MRINQLKAGVLLSYLSMGISSLISILYTPVMLRLLGQSEYGLYQLVFSVVSYLGLLSFGFSSAYVRFFSKAQQEADENRVAELNGVFMTIFLVIGLIALVSGILLSFRTEVLFGGGLTEYEVKKARVLMILMSVNISLTFPDSILNASIMAHEQYLFQRILTLVKAVLNPFLALPLLFMGFQSIGLTAAATAVTVTGLIVNLWFCMRKIKMRFRFGYVDIRRFKEIWIFSFFIFLSMITDQINWSVDKFILGRLSGSASVAVYSVGGQLNSYYMQLAFSVSAVFIPKVHRIVAAYQADRDPLTDLFIKIGRIQFMILGFVLGGFIVCGQYFISVWAGQGYGDAYYIALLLMAPVTISLIEAVGIEIQRAKNMHKFRSIVYFMIAVCNIFISIPLCKAYGTRGAAIGTAITLILGNGCLMNWYYYRRVGLDIKRFFREIFRLMPPPAIAAAVSAAVKGLIVMDSMAKFFLIGALYSVIYVFCLWRFSMNQEEKKLFLIPLGKLRNRREKDE